MSSYRGIQPMGVLAAQSSAVGTVDNPLQHAHVLAEAGPHELALGILSEPVHVENARVSLKLRPILIQ